VSIGNKTWNFLKSSVKKFFLTTSRCTESQEKTRRQKRHRFKQTYKPTNKQTKTNNPYKTKNKPKMELAVRFSNSTDSVFTNGKIFRSSLLESDQC
jgi:hypothetical protein